MRLAVAEEATIMPAYLARVPRTLPLDAALPQQCLRAMPLLEDIEQRALACGLTVDARIGRGRTYRDALRHVIDEEPVDRSECQPTGALEPPPSRKPPYPCNAFDIDALSSAGPSR